VIASGAWKAQPWKNGRGTTWEVLRIPDAEEYDLRISVAEVTENGPFSTFPGYKRWTLALEGTVLLWIRQTMTLVPRTHFLELDGAWELSAEISGPAKLLNVIARAGTVGVGDGLADIAFDLATRTTVVYDAPTQVRGVAWIRKATSSID